MDNLWLALFQEELTLNVNEMNNTGVNGDDSVVVDYMDSINGTDDCSVVADNLEGINEDVDVVNNRNGENGDADIGYRWCK